MTAPHRPTFTQRYPLQSALTGAALVLGGLACAGLAGIGVVSLITTGRFVWPGGPSAMLHAIIELASNPTRPANAYPSEISGHLPAAAALWGGAGIGTAIAGMVLWKVTVAVATRRDPRRHIEKAEKIKGLERHSSSAWGRTTGKNVWMSSARLVTRWVWGSRLMVCQPV